MAKRFKGDMEDLGWENYQVIKKKNHKFGSGKRRKRRSMSSKNTNVFSKGFA